MRLLVVAMLLTCISPVNAAQKVMSFSGEGQLLELTKLSIADARAINDDKTNGPRVVFRLTAKGGRELGKFTTSLLNKQVELRVCGKKVSSFIVRAPIFGGSGFFSAPSANQAQQLADQLKSGICE